MKIIKVICTILILLVAIVGGVAWYLFSNVNTIVHDQIELIGSEQLKTQVLLDSADIQLIKGSGSLNEFAIRNYDGFQQSNLLTFQNIEIDIDPASITKDVIVIDKLNIDGVSVMAEQLGKSTNIQALLDILKDSSSTQVDSAPQSSSAKPIFLAVRELSFTNNTLSLATEKYGTHTLALPTIVQKNIGSETQGLTPEQLARAIAEPLLDRAKIRIEGEIRNKLKSRLIEKADVKKQRAKERIKQKLKDKLGEDVDGKLDKLKNLL